MRIADEVRGLAAPLAERGGCAVWDAEYLREGGRMVLRLLIDKPGGVSTGDCEAVSRALESILDERDPIPGPYTLEVSSAGVERPLKRPEHFEASIGRRVEVSLYAPDNGSKRCAGTLRSYGGGVIGIETPDGVREFDMKAVSRVGWLVFS
ncbi:MAG: ribosome maturation factor RimP [Oscillospiraceae bacterium]|nr:ribosome maturation factor RimP [Oscillospiraceae bacterium]